jgi:hypothetical protein
LLVKRALRVNPVGCGARNGANRRNPHNPSLTAAIQKKLLDGVAGFAPTIQSTELAFKISEAEDLNRSIQRTTTKSIDEGGN